MLMVYSLSCWSVDQSIERCLLHSNVYVHIPVHLLSLMKVSDSISPHSASGSQLDMSQLVMLTSPSHGGHEPEHIFGRFLCIMKKEATLGIWVVFSH